MRRIVRTVAASIVVILGLALVSVAAFSSDIAIATLPEAPEDASEGRAVAPLDPNVGNGPARKVITGDPYLFQSEFGQRGEHDVEVVVTGVASLLYAINWRNDQKPEWGLGQVQRRRTIDSGFPVVRVTVNGGEGEGNATCVITVDGVEKDRQSTSSEEPIVACEA